MDRCERIINKMEQDVFTLKRSQDYYRRKKRKLGVKRDQYLNLKLL